MGSGKRVWWRGLGGLEEGSARCAFCAIFWVNFPSSIRKECDPDLLSPSFRNLTFDLATGGHHGALAGYRVVVGGHGPEVTVDGAVEGQRTDRRVEADQGLDLLRRGCVGLDESL